ncbi:DUF763 domain-containing protein [Chloroflexota bacterium]
MSHSASRTGIANLPLHGGKAPPWLFNRMVKLARQIAIFLVSEFGPEEMLRRMSDPYWFQAFGCVLGFDWHSSGVTTTVCGALKEGLSGLEEDLGLFIAGGKGRTSRRTPAEIEAFGSAVSVDPSSLTYASRMAAKVDSSAVQDGYQLYHHVFLFTRQGSWAVVQQGMNEANRYARRYHWLGESVADYVCEPHAAICSQGRGEVLNLVAAESAETRTTITSIATEQPIEGVLADIRKVKTLDLPRRHHIITQDIHPDRLGKSLAIIYERQPRGFEDLLGIAGVGPKTVRALSLISELVYGVPASFRDPARYSFAHGGKDGHPFPVDRQIYDSSIELLARAVNKARLDGTEKRQALSRLNKGFRRGATG